MQESIRSVSGSSNRMLFEGLRTISAGAVVVVFCLLLLWREPGFFWRDDFQVYFLPGFRDIARAWDSGELPLLSPYTWFGGGLAGEYPYGIFSIFISLCVVLVWKLHLTLPLTAAALSIIHLGILASGAFRLARQRGLTTALAMMVALVASLNGWIICWGATTWFSSLSSFVWLPWAWWSLELSTDERRGIGRFVPAGIFIYLILTAGWPLSVLMMALVSTWLGIKTWWKSRQLRILWPVLAAWVFGIGLSAPALLIFVEYLSNGLRGETGFVLQQEWMVPGPGLLGLIFPAFPAFWYIFGSWRPHASIELACGLAPAVALLAALFHLGKTFIRAVRWELGLLILVLLLALSPGLGNFRYSYRWLPLFHLLLAIVAAEALALLRTKKGVAGSHSSKTRQSNRSPELIKRYLGNLGAWALLLVFIVWVRSLLLGLTPYRPIFLLGFDLIVVSLVWLLVEQAAPIRSSIRVWMPFTVALLSLWATYTHVPANSTVMTWDFQESISSVKPLDPEIRYMSLYQESDNFQPVSSSGYGFGTLLRPGDSSMYSGVEFINGYTPIAPVGLARTFKFSLWGFLPENEAQRILEFETGSQGLLELLGVDGLVVAKSLESEIPRLTGKGWREVVSLEEGRVFHRIGSPSPRIRSVGLVKFAHSDDEALEWLINRGKVAVPLILKDSSRAGKEFRFAPAQVRPLEESRLQVIADVESVSPDTESLVVFSRPWYPGYHAMLNGKNLPVKVLNLFLPAVQLPPGAKGRLILQYRPLSLVLGSIVSVMTVVVTPLAIALMAFKRKSPEVSTS